MAEDSLDYRGLLILQPVPCLQQQTPDSQDSLVCASSHSWAAAPADPSVSMVSEAATVALQPGPPTQASTGGASQVPRRAGRPVKYQGDINSPLLSEGDRSRLQRRVENRLAACRLRAKQHDTLKNALSKVTELRQCKRQLEEELQDKQTQRKALQEELQQAQAEWSPAVADQEQLQARVLSLRKSLEVGLRLLEQPIQAAKLTPIGYPTYMAPAGAQIGSPVLSSSSCEAHQPLPFSSFAPPLTARGSLPSQWVSSIPGQFSEGVPNRAGRLPEDLLLGAGHDPGTYSVTSRAFSDPGPFCRPDPGSGLFSALNQFSRSGSFHAPGLFCNLEQGQGSMQGLPSGSSMGSTIYSHDSSPTLRDYLLSSNSSHDTVSSVYHSVLSPNPSGVYTSSTPMRQMPQLHATILNSNSHYPHLLSGMDTEPGMFAPWHQAQSQVGAL